MDWELGTRGKDWDLGTGRPNEGKTYPATVTYRAMECPVCNSRDVKIHGTKNPVRYHNCRACGVTFKSLDERGE